MHYFSKNELFLILIADIFLSQKIDLIKKWTFLFNQYFRWYNTCFYNSFVEVQMTFQLMNFLMFCSKRTILFLKLLTEKRKSIMKYQNQKSWWRIWWIVHEIMNWEEKSDWMKIITSQENIMNTSCYSNQIDSWIAVQWSSMLSLWILKKKIINK